MSMWSQLRFLQLHISDASAPANISANCYSEDLKNYTHLFFKKSVNNNVYTYICIV